MPAQKHTETERELVDLARQVLPGGGFGNVSHEVIVARGQAGRVWDVSGNEYVDYLLGSGPMIVGHAHPEVVEVVQRIVAAGTTFFANNEHGIRLAAEIVDAVACAEKVRFVSTGSEADAYAMRLARAYTGRDKILKFEGGYHGMSDYGLMSLAPKRVGNFPQPIPDSAGIPKSVRDEVLVAPFNDLESVATLIREHKSELAGIIVEPFQRLIPPKPGFLEGLRKLTRENGLVLIFDEVVTGFRFAYGGAQAYYGVTPDVCTLGKAIGGGFPLAAIAGRADIMAHFDKSAVAEDRFMMQVGTLSGNPVAAAAGLKTLEILKRPGTYERIFATGRALMEGYADVLKRSRLKAQVIGDAPMFDITFTDREVKDYRSAQGDEAAMKRCNALLRERGILKSESKYYISAAHTEADIAFTLDAFASAIAELQRARAA
ncbi:MAG TPA: aminotransferase class III-fold pyridoxal phosphate-dependent enzyme [Hyphomicrobiaceae bacterium]|nr:aminotransferase class III-fold pyridoxal phosphate-dependent enzyme [Hyphomicrobiaceae bacterium]